LRITESASYMQMIEITVPASTANLGPGFDTQGLALQLYLKVKIEQLDSPVDQCIVLSGEGASELPRTKDNLIYRSALFAAEQEGVLLPPARLYVENEIPIARGLGSSSAAIIAGLSLFEALSGMELGQEKLLKYGAQIEGHADNIAPALMGGLVTTCLLPCKRVLAVKQDWPEEIKAVVVIPDFQLSTAEARAALPTSLSRQDVIYNIQRVALFGAALRAKRFDYLSEAMKDRLHQPARQALVPGLEEILNLSGVDGLLAVALSGAGPTVLALATHNLGNIGELIAEKFARRGIKSEARQLAIDKIGRVRK